MITGKNCLKFELKTSILFVTSFEGHNKSSFITQLQTHFVLLHSLLKSMDGCNAKLMLMVKYGLCRGNGKKNQTSN